MLGDIHGESKMSKRKKKKKNRAAKEQNKQTTSVAIGSSAGRSQGSNKKAIILKLFGDVDHLKRCLWLCQH